VRLLTLDARHESSSVTAALAYWRAEPLPHGLRIALRFGKWLFNGSRDLPVWRLFCDTLWWRFVCC